MRPIYHFHKISEKLSCAGQPTADQLKQLAVENYEFIINLGLLNTKYALPDDAGLIKDLGIGYYHIPVNFEKPQLSELETFIAFMDQNAGKKIMVHCVANYRASVFTGLYLLAAGKMDEEEMEDLIDDIWQPNTIWRAFLNEGIEYVENQKEI